MLRGTGTPRKQKKFKILTEIQHFSGKTNLLDFTTYYPIALFFACNSFPFKDGRIILQDKNGAIKDWIMEPGDLARSRVRNQKSVFIRPPEGFIEPHEGDIVTIPANLKQPMLDHLRENHRISAETIYPDLHGFVSSQDARWNIYVDINKGNNHLESGQEAEVREEKVKSYQKAVKRFTNAIDNAIQLNEGFALAYKGRGSAYFSIGELENSNDQFENAIADFSKAIELMPKFPEAYHYRGLAYFLKGNFDNAIADLNEVTRLNPNCAEAYHRRGIVYLKKGNFDSAIVDLDKAIKMNPNDGLVYYSRGEVWLHLREWSKAKADLTTAREKGVDITAVFHNNYENVGDFGQRVNAELPQDLASMLTQQ